MHTPVTSPCLSLEWMTGIAGYSITQQLLRLHAKPQYNAELSGKGRLHGDYYTVHTVHLQTLSV